MSAGDIILKANVLVAKFNPYHDRAGRFANGPGRAAPKPGDAPGGAKAKPKTQAQKDKDVASLTDAQYKRYAKAPAHMDHDAAMAHAKGVAPKPVAKPAPTPKPAPKKTIPKNLTPMSSGSRTPLNANGARGLLKTELGGTQTSSQERTSYQVRGAGYTQTAGIKVSQPYPKALPWKLNIEASGAKAEQHLATQAGSIRRKLRDAGYEEVNINYRVDPKTRKVDDTRVEAIYADSSSQVLKGTNVSKSDVLSKAYEVLSKFNPYHDRRGLFASGPGGGMHRGAPMRTASMDGLRNATGGGTGGKKISQAQKDKDVSGLTDAQYKRYANAPKHLDHTAAMKMATETRGRPPVNTAPKAAATKGKELKKKVPGVDFEWPDPGAKPGDPKRNYNGMHKATLKERAEGVIDSNGVRIPIPGPWRDVWVANNPAGRIGTRGKALLVEGFATSKTTGAVKTQPIQPSAQAKASATEKFGRVTGLAKAMPKIDRALDAAIKTGDQKAIALGIIRQTGMRIGSQAGGGLSVKRNKATGEVTAESTFGVINLQNRHITVTPKGVRLQFTGKSGMSLDTTVKGPPSLVKQLTAMKNASKGKPGTANFFDGTVTHSSVTKTTKTIAGDYKNHDFRTLKANTEAVRVMASMPKPRNVTELNAARTAVGNAVGAVIGDKGKTALDHYIQASVFKEWEAGIA